MSANAALFKMKHGLEDLALAESFESPMGNHFIFQQSFDGVPVYGARVAVHFNKAGAVVGIGNKYLPDVYVPATHPSVSKQSAVEIAQARVRNTRFRQSQPNWLFIRKARPLSPGRSRFRLRTNLGNVH